MIELRTLSLLEELRCHVALAQQYGILKNTIAFYYVYLYQFLSQHGIDVMGIRYYNNSGINIYKVNLKLSLLHSSRIWTMSVILV